jgi:hypothetical protein
VSQRTLVALTAAAAVLAGCTPTTTRQVPASPGNDTTEPAPARDCSRQFDENDAGFQTCLEGPRAPQPAP